MGTPLLAPQSLVLSQEKGTLGIVHREGVTHPSKPEKRHPGIIDPEGGTHSNSRSRNSSCDTAEGQTYSKGTICPTHIEIAHYNYKCAKVVSRPV